MTRSPPPPAAKTPTAPVPDSDEDLPTGRAVILVNVPRKGWVVLNVETQGERIVSSTLISGPTSRAEAMEQVKIQTVRHTLVVRQ